MLEKILKQLRASCKNEEGEEDQKKGTQLLEIYALEIQMHTEQKNNKVWKGNYGTNEPGETGNRHFHFATAPVKSRQPKGF